MGKYIIEMDEVCDLSYMNICQRHQRECSGELHDRPEWCDLIKIDYTGV